jgi:hypothetical protein
MSGYAFHPNAFIDIDEIAIHIGQDSPAAAPLALKFRLFYLKLPYTW